jgi:hypothetical protein
MAFLRPFSSKLGANQGFLRAKFRFLATGGRLNQKAPGPTGWLCVTSKAMGEQY